MFFQIASRSFAASFLIAIFFAAVPTASHAQGLKGKTVKATYTLIPGACRPSINKCEDGAGRPGNANIYISTKGRIFDYASGQTGQESASGQWTTSSNGQRYKWTLRGNSIVGESDHELLTQYVTYSMTGGGGCTISVNSKSKHRELYFTTRAVVDSCVVADGLVER